MEPLRYIFGPLPSRRLGRSLGVDIIPAKTCTLDCVYCELGLTDKRAMRRKEYVPASEVIEELRTALSGPDRIDMITFSGSGEPTLNSALGTMIHAIKGFTSIPVAVITNGTLLYLPEVRRDLMEADVLLPSLDAATTGAFKRVNRPHPHLQLGRIIDGMKAFRKEYRGQIWLEILFVKGLNDSEEEISAMKRAIEEIKPDKIQLNTVVRPPAESIAQPISRFELEGISSRFGPTSEVIGLAQEDASRPFMHADADRVIAILCRRAMTLAELSSSLGSPEPELRLLLDELAAQEMIESFEFDGKRFFEAAEIPA